MLKLFSKNKNKDKQYYLKNFGFGSPQGFINPNPEYNVDKVKLLINFDRIAPFYKGISEYIDNPFPKDSSSKKKSDVMKIPIKITQENIYKYPIKCQTCLMFFPRNINYTTCCDKPICTECFSQIKKVLLKKNPENKNSKICCPLCSEENFGVYYFSPQSDDYILQLKTILKAKSLNVKEDKYTFENDNFYGKTKKDMKTLTEKDIVTSEYFFEEELNEVDRQRKRINEIRNESSTQRTHMLTSSVPPICF